MRLLYYTVVLQLWTHALRCGQGTVVERGLVVNRKEQEDLVKHYQETNDKICYTMLNSTACARDSFSVMAVAASPAFSPPHPLECWEKNSSMTCSCTGEDFCNIRLYDLLSTMRDYKNGSGNTTDGATCMEHLLIEVLPRGTPQKDNTARFPSSTKPSWWLYLMIVTAAVNIGGFFLYCGDRTNSWWKARKLRKEEEEHQRRRDQEAKIKAEAEEKKKEKTSSSQEVSKPDAQQVKPVLKAVTEKKS